MSNASRSFSLRVACGLSVGVTPIAERKSYLREGFRGVTRSFFARESTRPVCLPKPSRMLLDASHCSSHVSVRRYPRRVERFEPRLVFACSGNFGPPPAAGSITERCRNSCLVDEGYRLTFAEHLPRRHSLLRQRRRLVEPGLCSRLVL
jgi:hypothetical protein